MATVTSPVVLLLGVTTLLSLTLLASSADADGEREVYIVYMGERRSLEHSTESLHLNILDQVLESSSARESLVYSYRKSFNGLAARLTHQERQKLAGMEGIVSVFRSRTLHHHTTRSWDFLGVSETAKRNPPLESDVIVGMMDTGIWPESESFRDEGFGPLPSRWKGACQKIKCNNKLIGARYYTSSNSSVASPRDFAGHGSHTASTVAGRRVENASLYGVAKGIARGGVPSARLAVYKVCWENGCQDHDILAAFDDAISDGVDVISISIGGSSRTEYFADSIAIGSFHAMRNGILTSASAGNDGPDRGTASNVAPWMLVSAASSIDRRIVDELVLGNRKTIVGATINTFPTQKGFYPLKASAGGIFPPHDCTTNSSKSLLEGNIVLCGCRGDPFAPLLPGAKGAVMVVDTLLDVGFALPLPAVVVSKAEGRKLAAYINSTRNPIARIRKSEGAFDSQAPVVASFSSRGPNLITPDILKPDISAPGIDILAAWSPKSPMTSYMNDTRSVKYQIISGTSMSCPHVTGAAAYVKSFHPKWSPSAIMSALMTTASPMKTSLHPDAELAYGAGHIDPIRALHPGLVYEAEASDYVQLLCDQGYNTTEIRLITGDRSSCPKDANGSARDLNYPSMAFFAKLDKPIQVKFSRTVTNVGTPNSNYTATIHSDSRVNITVNPPVLRFKEVYEKLRFAVTISGKPLSTNSVSSASIVWSDGKHRVRSPIVVHTNYTVPMNTETC